MLLGLGCIAHYVQMFEMRAEVPRHVGNCGLKPVANDGAALQCHSG